MMKLVMQRTITFTNLNIMQFDKDETSEVEVKIVLHHQVQLPAAVVDRTQAHLDVAEPVLQEPLRRPVLRKEVASFCNH